MAISDKDVAEKADLPVHVIEARPEYKRALKDALRKGQETGEWSEFARLSMGHNADGSMTDRTRQAVDKGVRV